MKDEGQEGQGESREVSPTVTRSNNKKHYLNHFVKESKLGCVRKSSMAEIRREFQDAICSTTIVCPLGSQESLHSTQSYFLEAKRDQSELTILQDNLRNQEDLVRAKTTLISRLEAQVSTLTEQVAILTQQVGVLMKEKADRVYSLVDEDRCTTIGMQMSVRTFMDHIISVVYSAAGLSDRSDYDMAVWLRSGEATSFFEVGHSVTLFDMKIAFDLPFLAIVRGFNSNSNAISRKYAHSTKPILVATTLSNLLFKESDGVAMLFKTLFQYSCGELTNKYEANLLTKEETVWLAKRFSSRY